MDKVKKATNLVDLAFNEGFEIFGKLVKAEKKVEKILDNISGKAPEEIDLGKGSIDTTGRPYQHPTKVRPVVDVEENDMMGMMDDDDEYEDQINSDMNDEDFDAEYDEGPEHADNPYKETNDINHVPNQDAMSLYKSIRKQLGEWRTLNEDAKERYRAYFQKILKQYGVTSPSQLPANKKKDFFNRVDAGWSAKKENLELHEGVFTSTPKEKILKAKKNIVDLKDDIRHSKEMIMKGCQNKPDDKYGNDTTLDCVRLHRRNITYYTNQIKKLEMKIKKYQKMK